MASEQIQTKMEAYFETLSQHAPRATVNSHKASIRPFVSLCQSRGISLDTLTIAHVKAFLTPRLASHSIQTIKGHVDSLANFLAYVYPTDPTIVKAQIYHSPNRSSVGDKRTWSDMPDDASPCLNANDPRIVSVKMLIDHLRQRRYGSRTHAFVEMLSATPGQLSVIQQANVDNLNLDESTATIRIPQTHAVSLYGLLQERTVSLPSKAIDALEVYLEHERVAAEEDGHNPLFTTPSGRVDLSTVRRSIKQASKASLSTPIIQHDTSAQIANESRDDESLQTITPTDVWRYSLTQRIEH